MSSWLALISLLAACSHDAETPAQADVAREPGVTALVLQGDMLVLDGVEVCALHKPGVLRASRHRKLYRQLRVLNGLPEDPPENEVEKGLSDPGRSIRIVVSPDTPYADLFPILATSAWAGFGTFYLEVEGGSGSIGPILLDNQLVAIWSGQAVRGVAPELELKVGPQEVLGWLRFLALVEEGEPGQSAIRRVPRSLRVLGEAPMVDCDAVYAGRQRLADICHEGQRPLDVRFHEVPGGQPWPAEIRDEGAYLTLGGATGCLAGGPIADDHDPDWRAEVATTLQALHIDETYRITVTVDKEVSSTALLQVLGAFTDAGLALPRIKPLKPKPSPQRGCEALLRSQRAVEESAARWLGELRAP